MSFEKLVSLPLGAQTNRHWLKGMSQFDYRDYGSRWVFKRSNHKFQCSIPCFYVFFCYILLKPNRNIWKQLKTAPPNCAQTEKQCVRLCLIWPNSPPKTVLRKKKTSEAPRFSRRTPPLSGRQTLFQIWNPALFFFFFFFTAEIWCAKNPTFQTHSSSSLSCLPPSVYPGIHQRHYCRAHLISACEMKTSSQPEVQAKG